MFHKREWSETRIYIVAILIQLHCGRLERDHTVEIKMAVETLRYADDITVLAESKKKVSESEKYELMLDI